MRYIVESELGDRLDECDGTSRDGKEWFDTEGGIVDGTTDSVARLLAVGCEANGGGGQSGTGVRGLLASLEDEGGVSLVTVHLAPGGLTGVDGSRLIVALDSMRVQEEQDRTCL